METRHFWTARDSGHVDEIVRDLQQLEEDNGLSMTDEIAWLRNLRLRFDFRWVSTEERFPPIDKVYEGQGWSEWVLVKMQEDGQPSMDQYRHDLGRWVNNGKSVKYWMTIPN